MQWQYHRLILSCEYSYSRTTNLKRTVLEFKAIWFLASSALCNVIIALQPIQCHPDDDNDDTNTPSMIILDKISSLLVKALGNNWGRIHSYCYRQDGQFNVAISNIKREFQDHPHMQILMTLKQWSRAECCSCKQLYDTIKPLLDHSPDGQSQLRMLLFNEYYHGMWILLVQEYVYSVCIWTHTHTTRMYVRTYVHTYAHTYVCAMVIK